MDDSLRKGVIFDGDDTLWETMPLYTDAKQRFFDLIARLDFDRGVAEERFEAIDHDNVKRFGFSQQRFPRSMVETYEELCFQAGCEPNESVSQQATEIGRSVFVGVAPLIAGAKDVLEVLRREFLLILATKGDRAIQRRRIEHAGLRDYFAASYVLDRKTAKELMKILQDQRLDPAHSWAVGNSLRSDIIPALGAGLNVIWIPCETWSYEHGETSHSARLFQCKQLGDVVNTIRRRR